MPTIEFVGQSSQDPDNTAANTSRLINLYREAAGGRSPMVLKSVLGMAAFADIDGVFLRAMREVRGVLYIALGGGLYKVTASGTVTLLGAITESEDTTISSNNGKVTIAAGGDYFVWDGSAITQPTTGGFSAIGDVGYIGQRTILLEAGGRRVQPSDVADPSTFDAGEVSTTETRDDYNLRGVQIGSGFWIFKERSLEVWGQTTTGIKYAGLTIDRGLKARGLLAEVPTGVFFVGNDNRAYIAAGQGLGPPISNLAVETSIATQLPTHAFYYADEGHEFYVIRFSDRPAWCFDIASGEWHERAEGEDFGPWSAVSAVSAFGGHYVGTVLGDIYRLDRNDQDATQPLYRRAVSKSLRMDGKRFRVSMLEFLGKVGFSSLGRPAKMMMRVSGDYGQTWGAPKERSMGSLGDYDTRVVYHGLGQHRSVTVDVTLSDPADLTLDASATVEVA